jgi:hypothetical protein
LSLTFGNEDGEQCKEKHSELKKRYLDDKVTGVDLRFIEYLYLSDLISVIVKEGCTS